MKQGGELPLAEQERNSKEKQEDHWMVLYLKKHDVVDCVEDYKEKFGREPDVTKDKPGGIMLGYVTKEEYHGLE